MAELKHNVDRIICAPRNHEDHGIRARGSTCLQQHRRPRRVLLEAHHNVSGIAVLQYGFADRLHASVDEPDVRLQWNAQSLNADAPRNESALDGRDDGHDARPVAAAVVLLFSAVTPSRETEAFKGPFNVRNCRVGK